MNSLLTYFIELALLKRKPQDLPLSSALLGIVIALSWIIGVAGSVTYYDGVNRAILANGLDVIVILLLLRASLGISGFPERFVQTATALFGISTLFGALLLTIEFVARTLGITEIVVFSGIVFLIWVHVVMGFILQHALEKDRWAGIVIAVGYTMIGVIVVNQVIPPVVKS